jgi:capsular polysaccharide biosynthesis protein
MLRSGPIDGEVVAEPVIAENGITLPLIDVTATAGSEEAAIALAQRAANALDRYVEQQQLSNKVPASDRVVLQKVLRAEEAELTKPRPKTIPVVVFLVVMAGAIGLAFLLENLRPSPVQLVPEKKASETKDDSVSLEPRRRVSLR